MRGDPYRGAIEAIAGLFNHMNENDVVAVLTFGDEVQTITDFTRPTQALFDILQRITPDAQKTHFYEAIQRAFILNKLRKTGLPTRRAILVITDGKDEGSGIRLDDLLNNEIKQRRIPIYSVGFSKLREEKFLDELKRISNLSGGTYVRSDAYSGFAEIYTKTSGDIQEQMYIHVRAPDDILVTDGQDEGRRGALPVGEKGIIIGRQGAEVTPNIVLTDPKISRPHCLLQAGEDWFSVKNQSNTRATFVNGIRINDKHVFKDDECVINIGDTTIRINLLKLN
ncbi:hypothetical protein PN36_06260 [Candidatus Thiomargarita nelsonii]|uniref:FHA domain-containing protein n=1 Tax=Candidatus Thiomargarita nelsonii TaxID=1003181 RepID=A0A0A6P9B2_9GAMM|nr:hypothetical protein PN36_06260 [Candidatus Thiomargarita nelsonii]